MSRVPKQNLAQKLAQGRGTARLWLVRHFPAFYDWGGGEWSFGWKTGKDNDLICIRPHIHVELSEPVQSILFSPICSGRPLAFCAFILKILLVRADDNLKIWLIEFDRKLKRVLKGLPMTSPTINQAIFGRILVFATSTMRFPLAFTIPASIFPHQLLVASCSVMVMGYAGAFTISGSWWWVAISSPLPRFLFPSVRKWHIPPPIWRDNYMITEIGCQHQP